MNATLQSVTDEAVKAYLIRTQGLQPNSGPIWTFKWKPVYPDSVNINLTVGGKESVINASVAEILGQSHRKLGSDIQHHDATPSDFRIPKIVCAIEPVRVREAPHYINTPTVLGGEIDERGGALPGARYRVTGIEQNGGSVNGHTVWYRIEFGGSVGWVSAYYLHPCE